MIGLGIICFIIGSILGVLFISIFASGKISDLYSEIAALEFENAGKKAALENMRKSWALDTDTLVKTMRKLRRLEELMSYKHVSERPSCVDWYAVIRISHEYKTPYRDYALYNKEANKWGGSDIDPVVFWLPIIAMPLDPHKKYDVECLGEL